MTDRKPLLVARSLKKIFRGETAGRGRQRRTRVIALRRVSLEIRPGEIVGLIGGNGSGKTTLLRLLAGTSVPTSGQITRAVAPRVILSLAGNLNVQLTARENIYLYGSLLGILRQELRAREAAILDFAGLTEVADEPLRQYSLGMRLRLAFSVATCGEPKLILIDEVISAGDHAWQQNGLGRLKELARTGSALVIATHDLGAIQALATRAIWLDSGAIIKDGPAAEVVAAYQNAS